MGGMKAVVHLHPPSFSLHHDVPGRRLRRRPDTSRFELALDLERDDDAEQRGAFDERREDQRSRLDLAGRLGLTRHALDRLTADAADAHARADDGEAGAETGTDERETLVVVGDRLSGRLEEREERHVRNP